MSIDIIVVRNGGGLEGDDIVSPILAAVPVAKERGRNELDARATAKSTRRLEIKFRTGLEPGQLVEVIDSAQGRRYRGKVTEVTHRVQADPPEGLTNVTVEAPTEFYT